MYDLNVAVQLCAQRSARRPMRVELGEARLSINVQNSPNVVDRNPTCH